MSQKKILFCSPGPLVKHLGAPKVIVELVEEMRTLGWMCDAVGPNEIRSAQEPPISHADGRRFLHRYSLDLRRYLSQHAGEYDVVDYDHVYLPYPRQEFDSKPLFVARSVLLAHHLETIPIPQPRSIRKWIGRVVKGQMRRSARQEMVQAATRTIEQADLVNVSNAEDKAELIRRGIAGDKIVVLPFGLSDARRTLFDRVSSDVPAQLMVAFVGTFDYRKGAREFPTLVRSVVAAVPEARFRLLGTQGMFKTEQEILRHFPSQLRSRIEVLPRFAPEELPDLLAACSLGVFPSHMEGFPFGVLEMLAASLPVIAYDAPGPPMMLPAPYLVPRGDVDAMSEKVVALLRDERKLRDARQWAKQQAEPFRWKMVARETSEAYRNAAEARRSYLGRLVEVQ